MHSTTLSQFPWQRVYDAINIFPRYSDGYHQRTITEWIPYGTAQTKHVKSVCALQGDILL